MSFLNRTIEDIEILSYFDVIIIDDARLEIEIEKPRSIFDKIVAIKITRIMLMMNTEKQRSDITEIDFDDYYNLTTSFITMVRWMI